ncbi:hypothetical protein ACHAQD_007706 [Fusarium lateritium]
MKSRPISQQDLKPGVDYTRCQAEFDIQMLLLKDDIKKRFGWICDEQKGQGDDSPWPPHMIGSPGVESVAEGVVWDGN